MAKALSKSYKVSFISDDVFFVCGGKMGLSAISYTISKLKAGKKIVTTIPYYPDYIGLYENDNKPCALFVDILDSHGLTAAGIEKALDGECPEDIGAFIFCTPNNPMGWNVSKNEWVKIAQVLEKYKNAMIVLDEAYAEMVFNGQFVSLVTAAPHLKDRIIILRSATKGFSASGERMAIVATWNPTYMYTMKEYHFTHLIHAPKSAQFAYSYAMEKSNESDLKKDAKFYEKQVRKVEEALKQSGFMFSHKPVEGTFYVIGDFKKLLGGKISPTTSQVYASKKDIIEDDVDIAFHLLTEYGVAFMPLSLMGADPKRGLLRITCSMKPDEMKRMIGIFKKIKTDISKEK